MHLLDVRWQAEFAAGHVPGALSAPGGQLVECTDNWIGVRGGRIVVLDDDSIRARMAAGWLKQLGYGVVAVLAQDAAVESSETCRVAAVPDTFKDFDLVAELMASLGCVTWQRGLVDQVARDGLLTFEPYQPGGVM